MNTQLPHEISERWKQIRSYQGNKNVWYEGEPVALLLEYENAREAIEKYVNKKDKTWFHQISLLTKETDATSHLDSIFINFAGVHDLLRNASSPTAQKIYNIFADACSARIEQVILEREYERLQRELEEMKEQAIREGQYNPVFRNYMRNVIRMEQTQRKVRESKKTLKNQNSILKYFKKK